MGGTVATCAEEIKTSRSARSAKSVGITHRSAATAYDWETADNNREPQSLSSRGSRQFDSASDGLLRSSVLQAFLGDSSDLSAIVWEVDIETRYSIVSNDDFGGVRSRTILAPVTSRILMKFTQKLNS